MASLFRKKPKTPPPVPTVPAGLRFYAIGDVHGRLDLLQDLIGRIEEDSAARGAADTQIIFLGDLIDRGPNSAGVVDFAMDLARRSPNTRFIMGNHEEVFLRIIDGDDAAFEFFCRIGGLETILSYGVTESDVEQVEDSDLAQQLRARVPPDHISFIRGFADMITAGDYAFVHAGIRPGIALEQQNVQDLHWIREPFLTHAHAFERIIVHGHSITASVEERPNRIGIDTGAYETGCLTALGLQGSERWQLSTG